MQILVLYEAITTASALRRSVKQRENNMSKKDGISKEELLKVAQGIKNNLIFTDRHIQRDSDISMVFMVLLFMEKKAIKQLKDAGCIYEYYAKAGPRSVNGMPMFTSCHILNKKDAEFVWQKVKELEEAEKKVMEA